MSVERAAVEGFRTSPVQERSWARANAGRPGWLAARLRLAGEVPLADVARAVARIASRYEALRTRICDGDAGPVQYVDPAADAGRLLPEGGVAVDDASALARWRAFRARPVTPGEGLRLDTVETAAARFVHVAASELVADATSLAAFAAELAAELDPASPAVERDETLQYADLSEWLREAGEGDDGASARSYWLLDAGAPESVPVPLADPGAAAGGPALGLDRVKSRRLSAAVDTVATRAGVAREDVLLAAWVALLHRLNRQDRVTVYARIDGRTFSELQSAVGPFDPFLPLTLELEPDESLGALAARVAACRNAAVQAQYGFPWREVEEPEAAVGFCVDPPPAAFEGRRIRLDCEDVQAVDGFGARLSVQASPGATAIRLHYDASALPADRARAILDALEMMVRSAARDASMPIERLALMDASVRRALVERWNTPEPPAAPEVTLPELFARACRDAPDAVAVRDASGTETYRELDARAGRVCAALLARVVRPGDRVGILMHRSNALAAAVLGILRAGAAFVPLDPELPASRRRLVADDCGLALVAVDPAHEAGAEALGLPCVAVDDSLPEEGGEPVPVGPRDLAYVLYTSGSTGRPKGVMVEHASIANYLLWANRHYRMSEGSGAPLHTPIGFDLSLTALLGPLVAGRTVTFVEETDPFERLVALGACMTGAGYSLAKLTPSHLDAMEYVLSPHELEGSARVLVIGGEALHARQIAYWRRHAPDTRLVNEYGPTEATVGCCIYEVRADDPDTGPVPIGAPIANTRLYLLDRHGEPVLDGAVGEIHVGGAGVARGYWGRLEETAARFGPDPFLDDPAARTYRTGDLARRRADGALEYLERVDRQLKLRGHRIEPGEIESALRDVEGVREAAVVARRDGGGEVALVAYLVTDGDSDAALERARGDLAETLPAIMRPSRFVAVASMPLSANGKLDLGALPEPDADPGARERVAPADETERALLEVWSSCLDAPSIGVTDDFFELGGHSLLAVRVTHAVRERFDTRISLARLFSEFTIRGQARILRAGDEGATTLRVLSEGAPGAPPLFLIHPAGGHSLCYLPLARALGPERRVLGIDATGLEAGETPDATTEAMAERCVAQIRDVQPEGPYAIAGWSFGGTVAYEVASRLAARGETIGLLAMFDADAPLPSAPVAGFDDADRLADLAVDAAGFSAREVEVDPDAFRALPGSRRVEALMDVLVDAGVLPGGSDLDLVRRFVAVHRANFDAYFAYEPAPSPVPIALFRARAGLSAAATAVVRDGDPTLGWARLGTGGVEVVEVPGDHVTMMSAEHAASLAGELSPRLDAAAPTATRGHRTEGGRA